MGRRTARPRDTRLCLAASADREAGDDAVRPGSRSRRHRRDVDGAVDRVARLDRAAARRAVRPAGGDRRLDHRRPRHFRPVGPDRDGARQHRPDHRGDAPVAASGHQGGACHRRLAVGRARPGPAARRPHSIRDRPQPVGPGAHRQSIENHAGVAGPVDRPQHGRHRSDRPCRVQRRGRRRAWLRPAEDRLEFRQRHHSLGRAVDKTGGM
jgi:hypothetical protein